MNVQTSEVANEVTTNQENIPMPEGTPVAVVTAPKRKSKADAVIATVKASKTRAASKPAPTKPAAKTKTAAPTKPAAKTKAPVAAKTPRTPAIEQNGKRHPGAGTMAGNAWAIFDKAASLKGQTRETIKFKDQLDKLAAAGIKDTNGRAEFYAWRKFHGVQRATA